MRSPSLRGRLPARTQRNAVVSACFPPMHRRCRWRIVRTRRGAPVTIGITAIGAARDGARATTECRATATQEWSGAQRPTAAAPPTSRTSQVQILSPRPIRSVSPSGSAVGAFAVYCTLTRISSAPLASSTCTAQAMQGSKLWIVRRISIGCLGSCSAWPTSAAS